MTTDWTCEIGTGATSDRVGAPRVTTCGAPADLHWVAGSFAEVAICPVHVKGRTTYKSRRARDKAMAQKPSPATGDDRD